jgi:hypothetical protein
MSSKPFSIHLIRVVLVVSILAATGFLRVSTVYALPDHDDENHPAVGVAGLGDYNGDGDYDDYGDLPRVVVDSAVAFYNKLKSGGYCIWPAWASCFCSEDEDAHEEHFKEYSWGGKDVYWADDVDICWWQGHSAVPNVHEALSFVDTTHDDKYLEHDDARWGDYDLEWMLIHSCSILADDNLDAWGQAFHGLHLLCGGQSDMYAANDGSHVANRLIDDGWWDYPWTVKDAWFYGVDCGQPPWVILAILGESPECGNDFIWRQGPVCDDPPVDGTLSFWTWTCI